MFIVIFKAPFLSSEISGIFFPDNDDNYDEYVNIINKYYNINNLKQMMGYKHKLYFTPLFVRHIECQNIIVNSEDKEKLLDFLYDKIYPNIKTNYINNFNSKTFEENNKKYTLYFLNREMLEVKKLLKDYVNETKNPKAIMFYNNSYSRFKIKNDNNRFGDNKGWYEKQYLKYCYDHNMEKEYVKGVCKEVNDDIPGDDDFTTSVDDYDEIPEIEDIENVTDENEQEITDINRQGITCFKGKYYEEEPVKKKNNIKNIKPITKKQVKSKITKARIIKPKQQKTEKVEKIEEIKNNNDFSDNGEPDIEEFSILKKDDDDSDNDNLEITKIIKPKQIIKKIEEIQPDSSDNEEEKLKEIIKEEPKKIIKPITKKQVKSKITKARIIKPKQQKTEKVEKNINTFEDF
jgi:virulence-associated protein VagC